MNLLNTIARYAVGLLFIFSGLVKLNDPMGTAIKFEEYFEIFATDFLSLFHYFIPYSIFFSVVFCVLEVVLGLAVIIQYRMKITSIALLLLIVFFTLLTFYSAFTGNVTDCGCFGDAIPLTPWQSFYKDLVLLVLIIFILASQNSASNKSTSIVGDSIIGICTLFCIAIALYAIVYLPFIDFRPYKTGTNIPAAMQPSEPYRYEYIMEKDGKEYRFDIYPTEPEYQFKDMKLLNPGAQPKITDYHIWNDEGDFTEESFEGNKLLIIIENVNKARTSNLKALQMLIEEIENIAEVWVLTASDQGTYENFRHEHQIAAPYFYGDGTVLKTIIRSNPGLVLIQDGTVKGKWPNTRMPDLQILKEKLNE
ncbi:MAG: DoxX family protein [Cyclobacteriaceae bacterium]|nr:DoxX family protein [Cyclobacteriaceae bacterium]